MKELSIEEKAKAYDEAIKRAKEINKEQKAQPFNIMLKVFPELKESEDEKIRKRLLELFKGHWSKEWYGLKVKDIIAWLEKQANHANFCNNIQIGDKVTRNEDGVLVNLSQLNRVAKKQGEQKPTDKVEPKFHEGEWITNGDYTWKIVEVKPLDYILQSQDGNVVDDTISHVDEQFHSFTTQDAKNGDVLMSRAPFIYGRPIPYGDLDWYNGKFIKASNYMFKDSPVHPATKEQRELLFQKMKEAGYEWDTEKKELNKI